jgi:hypothetical protein
MLVDELEEFRAWFSVTDLFFFQYKSVWERIDSSVNRALKFLDAVVLKPEESHFLVVLNPVLAEELPEPVTLSVLPASRIYDEIILVGHSGGGRRHSESHSRCNFGCENRQNIPLRIRSGSFRTSAVRVQTIRTSRHSRKFSGPW